MLDQQMGGSDLRHREESELFEAARSKNGMVSLSSIFGFHSLCDRSHWKKNNEKLN